MKKVIVMLAAVAAMTFVSCDKKAENASASNASASASQTELSQAVDNAASAVATEASAAANQNINGWRH